MNEGRRSIFKALIAAPFAAIAAKNAKPKEPEPAPLPPVPPEPYSTFTYSTATAIVMQLGPNGELWGRCP